MARTLTEIQQEIIDAIQADDNLKDKLTSTSKTAIWRQIAYVVAASIWAMEKLFDAMKVEVSTELDTRQTHNLYWYANVAKAFQFGYSLPPDGDSYEVIDDAAQIVTQASVTDTNGTLIMKIAKELNGALVPLSDLEFVPFQQYIFRRKDAGVKIAFINTVGDDLRLVMNIFYDPLVLDQNGILLSDGVTEPAKVTIRNFIRNLPFDGEFIPAHLVDALQATEGIDIPDILTCDTKYATNDWQGVNGKVVPNAGYLNISDSNLTLNYIANV